MNITLTTSHSLFLPFSYQPLSQTQTEEVSHFNFEVFERKKEMVGKQSLWLANHPRCRQPCHFPCSRFQTFGVRHNARDNESCHRTCKNQKWNGSSQSRSRKSPVPTVQQRLYLFQAVNAIAVFKN